MSKPVTESRENIRWIRNTGVKRSRLRILCLSSICIRTECQNITIGPFYVYFVYKHYILSAWWMCRTSTVHAALWYRYIQHIGKFHATWRGGGGWVVLERRQTTQGKEEIYFCREAVSVRDSGLNSCGTVFWWSNPHTCWTGGVLFVRTAHISGEKR
jgi:hypothetical protein